MVLIPAGASISAWVLILLGKAKDYDKNSKKVAKLSRMSLGDEFVNWIIGIDIKIRKFKKMMYSMYSDVFCHCF